MKGEKMNRRNLLTMVSAAPVVSGIRLEAAAQKSGNRFRFCLNTATIQGQNLPLDKQIEVASKAGYQGIEPWLRDVDKFSQSGGSLKDMGKKCRDLGLVVESAIGFPEWVVNDDARRSRSIETLKKDLDGLKELGPTLRGHEIDRYSVGHSSRKICDFGKSRLPIWFDSDGGSLGIFHFFKSLGRCCIYCSGVSANISDSCGYISPL
jgi:hypothetical protein